MPNSAEYPWRVTDSEVCTMARVRTASTGGKISKWVNRKALATLEDIT